MHASTPLAERVRPVDLSGFVGQNHLLGSNSVLKKQLDTGLLSSMILWGAPGTGKTTLAYILAKESNRPFYKLSAINSGVKDIRAIIEKVKNRTGLFSSVSASAILFIDEIHRFNKSQQDSLLEAVEKGWIILIGATTENPSFEVNNALLSRCQVFILHPLDKEDLHKIIHRALEMDVYLKEKKIDIKEYDALVHYSGGDARKLLNILEQTILLHNGDKIEITDSLVTETVKNIAFLYDKKGGMHYDIISAFIKSVRGSDPNAAIYWLARMIEGGEDPVFIARRLIILAAEDIGLANPNALLIANACFDAVSKIGWPEARIVLSETVIYLSNSSKSNSAYVAIDNAMKFVKKTGNIAVPLSMRNAPTKLMEEKGFGKGYKYAHEYEGNFIFMNFLPDKIKNASFYKPGNNKKENLYKKQLQEKWKDKYDF